MNVFQMHREDWLKKQLNIALNVGAYTGAVRIFSACAVAWWAGKNVVLLNFKE